MAIDQRMRAIELATEQRSQPLEPSQLATDQRKKSTAITNVSKPKKLRVKITTHAPTLADLPKSLTSQLEQHRFAFAHCLYRLDIPYLRAEVLALTMAARRSRNLTTSGLAEAVGLLGASLGAHTELCMADSLTSFSTDLVYSILRLQSSQQAVVQRDASSARRAVEVRNLL